MPLLASDNFNRANENPLSSPWASVAGVGALRVVSNMVANSGTDTDCAMRYDGVAWPADHYSEVVVGAAVPQDAGPGVRISTSGQNGYFANAYDGWLHIFKWVSGVPTTVADLAELGPANGDAFRLAVAGNVLRVFVNGVQRGADATDSSLATGQPGVHIYESDVRYDSWAGGTDETPGTHEVSGRGSFAVDAPSWLRVALEGIPGHLTHGQAEPPNWYHIGMLSWGTDSGVMTAHIVTRELELIQLPAGMTDVYYQFAAGVTAAITELSEP